MPTNKPELIRLTDHDAIDLFAPEEGDSRPVNGAPAAAPAKSVDLFAPEVFRGPVRASVPFGSRSRAHPAALAALFGAGALLAVVLFQRSNGRLLLPVAPSQPSTFESTEAPPLPPVAAPPVTGTEPPVASVPEPTTPPAPSAPETTAQLPPPSAAPAAPLPAAPPRASDARVPDPRASDTRTSDPRAADSARTDPPPRLPRPLSQDPSRLAAGVPAPSSPPSSAAASRPPTVAPAAPSPAAPTVSPPASSSTAPAPAPASAPATASAPPVAAPSPTPTPAPTATPPPPPTTPAPTTPAAGPPATAAASPSPAPTPAAAPPAASAAALAATDLKGIQTALGRYQSAFSSLDASAARAVWPTVNERTLTRAFERLESQEVALGDCQVEVNNDRAEARCSGTTRYVPRVGSRSPHVDQRQWRFNLVKTGNQWLIGAVEAR